MLWGACGRGSSVGAGSVWARVECGRGARGVCGRRSSVGVGQRQNSSTGTPSLTKFLTDVEEAVKMWSSRNGRNWG
ncbi:uncharacterized [Tachysurus ichikawai]